MKEAPKNIGEANGAARPPRTHHVLGLLVLLAWAMVFTALVSSDRFRLYLMPAFRPILVGAVVVLSVCFVAKFAFGRGHHHDPTRGAAWIRALLLVLPLCYLAGGYGNTLGAYAFSKRQVSGLTGAVPGGGGRPPRDAAPREDGKDEQAKDLLQIAWNYAQLTGKRVTTIGQVTWDEKVRGDHFVLFRFVITCCVADAQPVAFLVRYRDQQGLSEDAWVEVTGTLINNEVEGQRTILIDADSVVPVEEPYDIYLYGF
jgi:uncharacterized repeat protein (TIGR03943 family)